MFVYKIINQINNKSYIGQTIRPVEQRFKRHISDAINNILDTHFARVLRKYGQENFSIEVIDTASNQNELNFKEQYWIKFYDSINNGYNETDALFKCGGNTYKNKTSEELKIIGNKICRSKTKELNPNAHQIKCYNIFTQEELIFPTVKDCQEHFNECTHRFITSRVTNKVKSLYKNIWKIAYKENEYEEFFQIGHRRGTATKIINLINGQEQIFDSIRQAARKCNINRNHINKHIKNNETEFIIEQYKIIILS